MFYEYTGLYLFVTLCITEGHHFLLEPVMSALVSIDKVVKF